MKKLTILVVDDIYVNRFLLSQIIQSEGHLCLQAENGKIAVDLIDSNDAIDVVLMDIEMPVMNGIETILHIRNKMGRKSSIPVIALTAHNPSIFFDDYKDVRFDELLTKPYSIDRVMEMIYRICL